MREEQRALCYAQVEERDMDAIVHLYEHFLNGGRASTAHLRQAIQRPGYLGVKCMDGDRLVGVFSALPGICFTYPHPELEQRILDQWGDTTLYSGDILVVLPEYRNRGIARELTLRLLELLRSSGVDTLLAEMWNPLCRGDRPASGIMKYLGTFEVLWEFPDFYKDLYDQGMTCPDCGDGPCRCGATVGVLALKREPEEG